MHVQFGPDAPFIARAAATSLLVLHVGGASLAGIALSAIAAAHKASEGRLGPSARALPSQLSKLLTEALSLAPSAFSTPAH